MVGFRNYGKLPKDLFDRRDVVDVRLELEPSSFRLEAVSIFGLVRLPAAVPDVRLPGVTPGGSDIWADVDGTS